MYYIYKMAKVTDGNRSIIVTGQIQGCLYCDHTHTHTHTNARARAHARTHATRTLSDSCLRTKRNKGKFEWRKLMKIMIMQSLEESDLMAAEKTSL